MFPFFFFGEPTDEQKAAMEEHKVQQKLHHVDGVAKYKEFYDTLTQDQLLMLRQIFGNAMRHGEGYVAYNDGVAATVLEYKFNVCPHCGVDHTIEGLDEVLGNPEGEDQPE